MAEKKIKYHLDFRSLREHCERLECRRLVLAHTSEDILAHVGKVDVECAEDGQGITLSGGRPSTWHMTARCPFCEAVYLIQVRPPACMPA